MKKVRLPRAIVLVTVLYLVAAISAAVTAQHWEFLQIYIPIFIVMMALISWTHRQVKFSRPILWCLCFWGLIHLAGGLITIPSSWAYDGDHRVLYSWWIVGKWLKWDHLVHAFGFGTCTWLAWESLRASVQARLGRRLYPSLGMVALCILSGMGLGAINELIEFVAVLNLAETNLGGYHQTGWDLVANLAGSLFAGMLISFRG